MLRIVPLVAVLFLGLTARADDGIPLKTLQQIKAATVFLKVKRGSLEASGTGFVVQSSGASVYLVTNHHVADPKPSAPVVDNDRRGPFPFIPPPPRFGHFPVRPAVDPNAKLELTAVFSSGTRLEQVYPATMVLSDEARDLALLEVKGMKTPPAAIVTDHDPELIETTSLYVFGFPFGESLSENDRNPAVSVGKASISSLREDKNGELATIQIDGALNPGNSGGPVVDTQGRLVGVSVATITGAGIGMAIPQQIVRKMLGGRAGNMEIASRVLADGKTEFEATVPLIDPFRRVKSVALQYTAQDQAGGDAPKADAALPGATKVTMTIKDGKATGRFTVPPKRSAWVLTIQTATYHDNGSAIFSTPSIYGMGGAAPQPEPALTGKKKPAANVVSDAPAVTPVASSRRQLSASGAARVAESFKAGDTAEIRSVLQTLRSFDPGNDMMEITEGLEKLLGSPEDEIRSAAADALVSWGRAESAPRLSKLLTDDEPDVRHAALRALVRLKSPQSTDAIADRLADVNDRDPASRALVALGPLSEKSVRKQLASKDAAVRQEACRILAQIGTADCLEDLRPLTMDSDSSVATKATEAIRKIEQRQ